MGIRINKSLGWILSFDKINLELLDELTITDLINENKDDFELNNLDLMYPFIDKDMKLSSMVREVYLDKDERIIIFQPPHVISEKDYWHRYNNPIDYYERGSELNSLKFLLGQEIFPYINKMVVSKSLIELNPQEKDICQIFSDVRIILKPEVKQDLEKKGIDFTFKLKDQIHQCCPRIIQLILKKCDDKIDFRTLKPGIVTWWD